MGTRNARGKTAKMTAAMNTAPAQKTMMHMMMKPIQSADIFIGI